MGDLTAPVHCMSLLLPAVALFYTKGKCPVTLKEWLNPLTLISICRSTPNSWEYLGGMDFLFCFFTTGTRFIS